MLTFHDLWYLRYYAFLFFISGTFTFHYASVYGMSSSISIPWKIEQEKFWTSELTNFSPHISLFVQLQLYNVSVSGYIQNVKKLYLNSTYTLHTFTDLTMYQLKKTYIFQNSIISPISTSIHNHYRVYYREVERIWMKLLFITK